MLQDGAHLLVYEENIYTVSEYLELYRLAKQHEPSLFAIFIVPPSLGGWRHLLKGMKLLKRLSIGNTILATDEGTHKSLGQNMHAFYDAPQLPDSLRMLVKGLINGAEGKLLLDTGASRSAMSATTAPKLGLPISSQPAVQVSGYDGETRSVNSATKATLKMGSYVEELFLPMNK